MKHTVKIEDLAYMLGVHVQDFPQEYSKRLDNLALVYEVLEGEKKEKAVLDQLKRIKNDKQIVGTDARIPVWQEGWSENLQLFIDSGYDLSQLRPKYYRENVPCRFKGKLIFADNPQFEYILQGFIKEYIYHEYFTTVDYIYEFGCGTGYNLVDMANLFPEKNLIGLDFVPSVMELLKVIKEKYNYKIDGKIFDIRNPDTSLSIKKNSAVCTFAALEQVDIYYKEFVQFLLDQHPTICVHIEPIEELYDENSIVDWLAKEFHEKRHYLSGYLTYLRELEKKNIIQIIKVKRLELGNFNHEGYSLVVWRAV